MYLIKNESEINSNSMTKIINLFSGPGAGKSSIAAGLTYKLKSKHISCDNPYEFPKTLAWDENHLAIQDQLYVLANQHRGIVKSYGKVDYIISDSPILLSLIYRNYYKGVHYPSTLYNESFDKMVLDIHSYYDNLNIVLKRSVGVYNEKERYQNLEKSIELDTIIQSKLDIYNIPYVEVDVDTNTVNTILDLL
jgi:deoxyadenosine/deoxycytidine kinase